MELGSCAVVRVSSSFSEEYNEDYEKDEPGISLVDQDGFKPNERDECCHHGKNNDADDQ